MSDFETRLTAAMRSRDRDAPLGEEVLRGVRRASTAGATPAPRPWARRWLPPTLAAASVLAVIGGAFALAPDRTDVATPPVGGDQALAVPPGMRLVGLNGIAVAVPQEWSRNDLRCGTPLTSTVVVASGSGAIRTCLVHRRPSVSAVYLVPATSPLGRSFSKGALPASDVDGLQVQRVPTTSNHGLTVGAALVEESNVVIKVDSPERQVVERILDTLQALPDGYSAVPPLPYNQTAVEYVQRLSEAGLDSTAIERYRSDIPPGQVLESEPRSGDIVPVDSTVTVTVAADGPAESNLPTLNVGSWQTGDAAMLALGGGQLEVDERGCVYLNQDDRRMDVVWPQGYTADYVQGVTVVIRNAAGVEVLREYDILRAGGGFSPTREEELACRAGDTNEVFFINEDLPPR